MARDTFKPSRGGVSLTLSTEPLYEGSCFGDEVVIDFPSPARAIDRMRHAFVGEEGDEALAAGLELSWREAHDGAVVALDVPVRCTCRLCGGRGETWAECCARCGGSGTELLRHQVQVAVPAGVSDGDRFRFSVTARPDPPTRIEVRVSVV